jgi:hypothetical protein
VNSPKRILDQLEQRRTIARPLATRSGRRHLFYAFGVAAAVAVLAAGVVTWGTDVSPRTVMVRDPVFRITQHPGLKSGVEEERLAAAIVNEPLQHHVTGQIRPASDTAAGSPDIHQEATVHPASRPARVPPAQQRVASTQASSQRATPRTDSDVALLAALVAHANGEASGIGRGLAAAEILSAQLRQCARLGGSEATLCHARACTGRWGRDNACRVTTAE